MVLKNYKKDLNRFLNFSTNISYDGWAHDSNVDIVVNNFFQILSSIAARFQSIFPHLPDIFLG